jgi:hypothetical protein
MIDSDSDVFGSDLLEVMLSKALSVVSTMICIYIYIHIKGIPVTWNGGWANGLKLELGIIYLCYVYGIYLGLFKVIFGHLPHGKST